MKRIQVIVGAALIALSVSKASAIVVDIYSGHGSAGGGAPYSGLVGSFVSPDIMFATSTGYAWHPFGLGDFGADITGCLLVLNTGTYSFTLNSDDGSLLFIDGNLVVDNGGAHGPQTVSGSVLLTAGTHPFNVQFYEDFGGPSGVDLLLPQGVSYTQCVPEGGLTIAMLGGVLVLIGLVGRRFQ